MKIKNNNILKKIDNSYVILPLSDHSLELDVILKVNEVGAFIYSCLENETTKEEVLAKILAKYEIDEATASADLEAFLKALSDKGLLE